MEESKSVNEPIIVKTDEGAIDGQNKCPKCGATDISVNTKTGKLRCNFCRHEFELEKLEGMETDLRNLKGEITYRKQKIKSRRKKLFRRIYKYSRYRI